MLKNHFLLILLLTISHGVILSQKDGYIDGYIISKTSKEKIAYATIYNISNQKGTISNENGYFKINRKKDCDTLIIKLIGYKDYTLITLNSVTFYEIQLAEEQNLLKEITIKASNDDYLYNLLVFKNNNFKTKHISKAYYELESFINKDKVEFIEAYYNIFQLQGKINEMQLKVGRFALKPYNNRFFESYESSKTFLNLYSSNFPISPVNMKKKELKKNFTLQLEASYIDSNGDSIYQINFKPKELKNKYFSGSIWLNTHQKHIEKIVLKCNQASNYPFIPIFGTDSICNVNMEITKSYSKQNNSSYLYKVDFEYDFDYYSRLKRSEKVYYHVDTKALLYFYNFDSAFQLPYYNFNNHEIGDYRKISAFPYNHFFWDNNSEYSINDSSNTSFFNKQSLINSKEIIKSSALINRSLFEHPFIPWSTSRIKLKDIASQDITKISNSVSSLSQYNLGIKLFIDINNYNDSLHVLSSVIFDPFDTYYNYSIDSVSNCYVNIMFDLCEIECRKITKELKLKIKNNIDLNKFIQEKINLFESEKYEYQKKLDRGRNLSEMKKYNDIIKNQLGIDNIKFFKLYQN